MFKYSKQFFILLLLAICLIEIVFILKNNYPQLDINLNLLASEIILKCKESTYRPTCYDHEIPKLMDKISMEDAFSVTKIVQKQDQDYRYCHVLGHELSAREVKKNPDNWQEVLTRCPQTMCNNGCLHGGMMERFQSESLNDSQTEEAIKDLINVCEPRGDWNPLEVERSMCYHAIGHLNMYITNADMQKAADLCKVEAIKPDGRDYTQTCVQGVFMQVFQPLDPEDFALIEGVAPKKEEVSKFCDKYDDFLRGACYRESWPLFRSEIITPAGSIKFCSYSKDLIENERCYSGLLSIVTIHYMISTHDENGLYNYCTGLPVPHNENCFGDAAERMIQIDPEYTSRALDICKMAEKNQFGDSCRKDLAQFADKGLSPETLEYKQIMEYGFK